MPYWQHQGAPLFVQGSVQHHSGIKPGAASMLSASHPRCPPSAATIALAATQQQQGTASAASHCTGDVQPPSTSNTYSVRVVVSKSSTAVKGQRAEGSEWSSIRHLLAM